MAIRCGALLIMPSPYPSGFKKLSIRAFFSVVPVVARGLLEYYKRQQEIIKNIIMVSKFTIKF